MTDEALWVCDTNILLRNVESLNDYKIIILSHTLRELEKHKISHREELAFQSRRATRYINNNREKFKFDLNGYSGSKLGEDFTDEYEDDNILQACVVNNYNLLTNDLLLQLKAEGLGIKVRSLDENHNLDYDYTGVKEFFVTDSEEDQITLATIYESPDLNQFDLSKNEYLYIWDKEKPTFDKDNNHTGYEFIDCFKFNGAKMIKLKYKQVFSRYMGEKIKPINRKQQMLFDLLQDDDITIKSCFGQFGVGKDFVMLSHALEMIEKGKVDKIIWARNNVELKDVPPLGILPGDKNEKLLEFAMPLADHVGGVEGLNMLIAEKKLEIQHLGSLRGRDIKNSILYVTESQNNTDEHFELLIGRVGKGSQLWLNGDLEQTDGEIYKSKSGVKALAALKGEEKFGMATLDKNERSDTAKLASKLSNYKYK